MNTWLETFRRVWRKIFFWQAPQESTQEFKPEAHHDHALVLSVTSDSRATHWNQLRFINRVLPTKERRVFWISLGVAVLALGVGLVDLSRPHIIAVPASGGAVTEAVIGTPKLINPLFAPLNAVDRDLAGLVYSGLFRIDDQLQPQPDLVDHYRWDDSGQMLEVTLRSDARFHDGEPVTSDDVIFTYQAVRNPNWRSPLGANYHNLKVVRVDDTTVQFQLDKPNPAFLFDLTLGILPAHVWEDISDVNAHLAEVNIKPVGSGPYQVVSFTRDSKGAILTYRLRLFPRYYGLKPNIQEWDFRFYPDRDQALTALRQNQVDSLAFVPWGEAADVKNENLRAATIGLPQETVAFFNLKDPLLKDDRVRKALDMAVDREELRRLIGEHTESVSSPFPFLTATTGTTVDLEGARALLQKIGWTLQGDKDVRSFTPPAPPPPAPSKKTGKTSTAAPAPVAASASSTPLAFTISVSNQPDLLKIADLLKRRWSLLGAQVDVAVSDPETLLRDAVDNRDYQVLLTNVLLPPNQDISSFWSSANAVEHGRNLSNLADRDVDLALDRVKAATSTQGLLAAQRVLSDAILARSPALFLLRPTYAYLVSKQIQGVTDMRLSQPEDRLRHIEGWYIKTGWSWK